MIELYYQNTKNELYNISDFASDITLNMVRNVKPSELKFFIIKHKDITMENGGVIIFKKDSFNLFYGYIFTIEETQDKVIKIIAYDQLQYLLATEVYVFKNQTLKNIMTTITNDFQLKLGDVSNFNYTVPNLISDNKKILDLINKYMDLISMNSGELPVLYDDFGTITIKDTKELVQEFIIGDTSYITGYTRKRDIGSDTFNYVKVIRDTGKDKKRQTYIVYDSNSIGKWGRLQYTDVVDEKVNDVQARARAENILKIKNRELTTFKITSIGISSVRAGQIIYVSLKDLNINSPYIIDSVTHSFNGSQHTMEIELRVI